MSITDNAFIKAYRDASRAQDKGRGREEPMVVTDLSGLTTQRMTTVVESVSGPGTTFVTSAGHELPPAPVAKPASKTQPPTTLPPTESEDASIDIVWRQEEAEPPLRGPYSWKKSSPSAEVPEMPPRRKEPNRPQRFEAKWEIDSFAIPDTCQQLHEQCVTRLTEVIRGVLQNAWQGRNILAITSFSPGEGVTTLAITLAHLASCFDIQVALVDGNACHPAMGETLGLEHTSGWETYGPEMPLAEIAIQAKTNSLVLLPHGKATAPMDESCGHSADLIRELTEQFELVVLDAGPMFAAAHNWFAEPAVAGVHGAIVVRDMRKTEQMQLHDVLARLDRAGIANVGIIENFTA